MSASCRVCGCTDDHACNPPCAWFDATLCTVCALAAEALREWSEGAVNPSLSALLRESQMDMRAVDNLISKTNTEIIQMLAVRLAGRARFISEHASAIGVRVKLDGRWENRMLSDLPPAVALREGFRLLIQPAEPHMKVDPSEARA